MNRHSIALLSLEFIIVSTSVPALKATEYAVPTHLVDIALPPALDRVLRDYEQAWREGDAAALASLFTEDGFVLQSGRPPVRGRSSIQAVYAGQGGSPLRLRALAYDAGDTSGSIIGAYGYKSGPNAIDTGKFTLTLRRTPDGKWLIFSDMDNTNIQP